MTRQSLIFGVIPAAVLFLAACSPQVRPPVTAPAPPLELGTLRAPADVRELWLDGPDGYLHLALADGVARVPAGGYRIFAWKAVRQDQAGGVWELLGRGAPDQGAFRIAGGRQTSVNVGQSVLGTVSARKTADAWFFPEPTLRGQRGERVVLTRNGQRPPAAPRLRITSADAGYDRTFTMEYG